MPDTVGGAEVDGELAGEGDDDCGCDEEAGSLDRCCHLILLLNRFFISATRNPLLGQGLRVSPPPGFYIPPSPALRDTNSLRYTLEQHLGHTHSKIPSV